MSGFGVSESDAREFSKRNLTSEGEAHLIAELDCTPIGKLNILLRNGGFIFGFCVHPEYRGGAQGLLFDELLVNELKTILKKYNIYTSNNQTILNNKYFFKNNDKDCCELCKLPL